MVFLPHWPKPTGIRNFKKEGLEPVFKFLDAIGNPQHSLPPIIHIAGTNGKGSTLAFIEKILQKAGYSCHKYTSPHLINFNERISLNGKDISDNDLYKLTEEVRQKTEGINTTFFEATTCLAFLAFSRIKADFLLLETGMGGRLDATNVIENPILTILTSIDLDHQDFLGNTRALIAGEKAGILKDKVPLVCGLQHDDAMQVIMQAAENKNCPTKIMLADFSVDKNNDNELVYISTEGETTYPKPALNGDHQYINAATAIASAKELNNQGYKITDQDIAKGLSSAKWSGRLQKVEEGKPRELLDKNIELWLDGAHNENALLSLASHIQKSGNKTTIIMGLTNGRNPEVLLKAFSGVVEEILAIKVHSEPNSLDPELIYLAAQKLGFKAQKFEYLEQAFEFINKKTDKPESVLVCGSLFLAAELVEKV